MEAIDRPPVPAPSWWSYAHDLSDCSRGPKLSVVYDLRCPSLRSTNSLFQLEQINFTPRSDLCVVMWQNDVKVNKVQEWENFISSECRVYTFAPCLCSSYRVPLIWVRLIRTNMLWLWPLPSLFRYTTIFGCLHPWIADTPLTLPDSFQHILEILKTVYSHLPRLHP